MPGDLQVCARARFTEARTELRALHRSVIENAPCCRMDSCDPGYDRPLRLHDRKSLHILMLIMFLALEEGSLSVENLRGTASQARLADLAGDESGRLTVARDSWPICENFVFRN